VTDPGALLALRTLMGIAIGAEYAIGAAVLSEFSPRRNRGTLLASLNGAWIVGFVGGFAVAYVMRESGADWRAVFASAAVPALVVFLLRLGSPESPRWLMANGRRDEAQEIVLKFYGRDYSVEGLRTVNAEPGKSGLSTLFSTVYRTRTIFAGGFWACQVMPLFALTIFLPQVFEALGIGTELGAEMLVNGFLLVGAVAGVVAIKYLPRRKLVIVTFAIVAVALVAMAFAGSFPVWFGVMAFVVFILVASAASNLEYVYPSEIFPTEVRATGMGFAAALSRVGAAASTFLLPVALEGLGNTATMGILAAVAVLGLVISILWAPETKGKSLEEASRAVSH
jgi:putative MFS transporter